jgi:hypothetical protein
MNSPSAVTKEGLLLEKTDSPGLMLLIEILFFEIISIFEVFTLRGNIKVIVGISTKEQVDSLRG